MPVLKKEHFHMNMKELFTFGEALKYNLLFSLQAKYIVHLQAQLSQDLSHLMLWW